ACRLQLRAAREHIVHRQGVQRGHTDPAGLRVRAGNQSAQAATVSAHDRAAGALAACPGPDRSRARVHMMTTPVRALGRLTTLATLAMLSHAAATVFRTRCGSGGPCRIP